MHLLALLLLTQADAGAVRFLEAATLHAGDAGVKVLELERLDPAALQADAARGLVSDAGWVDVGPGCYLPVARCMVAGARVEQLAAENAELRRAPPGLKPVITAAWVGFALGAVAAVVGIGGACWAATGNLLCR